MSISNFIRSPGAFEMNSTIFRLLPSIYVYHIESDRLIPGQILYPDMIALQTTNGSNKTDVFNFWAADRSGIWGFTQNQSMTLYLLKATFTV